jgi:alpha-D-ribose 1-methylphosphonate 5-triphosphate synthase subunit PhnH
MTVDIKPHIQPQIHIHQQFVEIVQTADEARTRETYTALMWSFAYPGRAHSLPSSDNGFVLIARTLLDLETSFFCTDLALSAHIAETGAQALPIDQAAYVFVPNPNDITIELLRRVNVGSHLYPDNSACLLVAANFDDGYIRTWRGPGIEYPRRVMLGGVPQSFWALRSELNVYPRGVDVLFVDRGRVMGLPRTTLVEVE